LGEAGPGPWPRSCRPFVRTWAPSLAARAARGRLDQATVDETGAAGSGWGAGSDATPLSGARATSRVSRSRGSTSKLHFLGCGGGVRDTSVTALGRGDGRRGGDELVVAVEVVVICTCASVAVKTAGSSAGAGSGDAVAGTKAPLRSISAVAASSGRGGDDHRLFDLASGSASASAKRVVTAPLEPAGRRDRQAPAARGGTRPPERRRKRAGDRRLRRFRRRRT
jgi:hypothetical protein